MLEKVILVSSFIVNESFLLSLESIEATSSYQIFLGGRGKSDKYIFERVNKAPEDPSLKMESSISPTNPS